MANITLKPLTINEECPNLEMIDETVYSTEDVMPFFDFMFHDFVTLLSTNTSYTINNFVFGSQAWDTSIDIETDGFANIINPEANYNALSEELNANSSGILTQLVKPSKSNYRTWYLRIYSYNDSFDGVVFTVDATAGLTPTEGNVSTKLPVDARNVTLYLPDGTEADLGAVKQIDTLTLTQDSYPIGETFTISFCGEDVVHTIVDTKPECIIKAIYEEILKKGEDSYFTKYIVPSYDGNVLTYTAAISGVPFSLSYAYTGTGVFNAVNTQENVSNLSIDGFLMGSLINYEFNEKGGEYNAVLHVLSGCEYNSSSIKFLSWCYDLKSFDCCFIEALKKSACKCKNGSNNACHIYNIKRAVEIMLENNYSKTEIQKVIDLGWGFCSSADCGCKKGC